MAEGATLARADREQFSLHPEDEMTESISHACKGVYLGEALDETLPGMFVACNLAVYWAPGPARAPIRRAGRAGLAPPAAGRKPDGVSDV